MHKMVIEACREGYVNMLYDEEPKGVEKVCLLDENGNNMQFKWLSRESIGKGIRRIITDFERATQLSR